MMGIYEIIIYLGNCFVDGERPPIQSLLVVIEKKIDERCDKLAGYWTLDMLLSYYQIIYTLHKFSNWTCFRQSATVRLVSINYVAF